LEAHLFGLRRASRAQRTRIQLDTVDGQPDDTHARACHQAASLEAPLSSSARRSRERRSSRAGKPKPRGSAHLTVTFDTEAVELPEVIDRLVLDQRTHATSDRYATHRSSWLFPGRHAGRPLATENFRSQLVALDIAPNQACKAAMFQLAAEMPAPVLADLLGVAPATASRWAKLAARDWSQYTAMRRGLQDR
jgi:hypothetical protein